MASNQAAPPRSASYEAVRGLPLEVDSCSLERLELQVPGGWNRVTTTVVLGGGGVAGRGEDPTYEAPEQDAFQRERGHLDLAGTYTLESFSRRLHELDLHPVPCNQAASRDYRRWAFESAALDLALRQRGASLAGVLGRGARPVTFVVSMHLEPSRQEEFDRIRRMQPGLRFKLDPTPRWDRPFMERLAATGSVVVLDLKGAYRNTPVDLAPDPELYAQVARLFPEAWIEDPAWTEETAAVLEPHQDRITWDATIHSVADVEALPFAPRMLNMKPSRFGTLERLFSAYDHCAAAGIGMYGGGQFELGAGRGQIQCLASLYHPDAPNDAAPAVFHRPDQVDALPGSPAPGGPAPVGFGWSA